MCRVTIVKREKKLLILLTVTVFIVFGAAIALFQPKLLSALCLSLIGIIAALGAWLLSVKLLSPASSLPAFSGSRRWPRRTADPDKLVDRMVSEVESFVADIGESRGAVSDPGIRQELHRRLGSVLEKRTGFPESIQTLEVTVLLSDLRGFSLIAESYSPLEVVDMLNRYLNQMYTIIYRYGGTVDKFMGDSIMALFGAPVKRQDPVVQAVRCAIEMQIAMDSFNEDNQSMGLPTLYMGIGINTGEAVAGKIGSDLHSEYTVIGEEVNLASRIEAYTLRGQILISHETYSRVKELVYVADPIQVSFKGRREPAPLYELLEMGDPYNLKVPGREARRSLRVDVNIPFTFQICEGKVVYSESHDGHILNISTGGMLATTFDKVEPYFNIKFRLGLTSLGGSSDDIFGKILMVRKESGLYKMNIEFTALNPEDAAALRHLVDYIAQGSLGPIFLQCAL
jgi:adenylate cyclase